MPLFSFTNAAFLFGLLAVAVPIILHLVSRLRYVEQDFSSTQFLEHSSRRTSRKIRLINVLLLLARILLLSVFTIALARPLLQGEAAGVAPSGSCSVIIVDNSYSMGYTSGNQTRLDRAKAQARRFIRTMTDHDQATLLVVSDRSCLLFEEPVRDRRVLLRALEDIRLSNRATDMLPALLDACKLLLEAEVPERRILLLGDLQRNGWLKGDPAHASLATKLNEMLATAKTEERGIRLYVVDCSEDSYANLGVSGVECGGQILGVRVPFELTASILASGKPRGGGAPELTLHLEGRPPQKAAVSATPAQSTSVRFSSVLTEPGRHCGYVALPRDDLPVDDRYHFSIPMRDQVRVLLARILSRSRLRSGTALALALRPEPGQPGILDVKEQVGAAVGPNQLKDMDVVILADECPSLSTAALAAFVAAGGGLIVFPDAGVAWLNANLAGDQPLLPGPFAEEVSATGGSGIRLHGLELQNGALSFFAQHPGALDAVVLKKCVPLEPSAHPRVHSLASDGAGNCLLAKREFGEGRVLAFGFGCGLEWGNPALTSTLVPLLYQSIFHLTGDAAAAVPNYVVGSTLRASLPGEDWKVQLLTPDGRRRNIEVQRRDGETSYEIRDTEVPGLYRVQAESDVATRADRFIVNLDTAESVLVPASSTEIADRLPQAEIRFVAPGERTVTATSRVKKTPLWGPLLLLAAALLVLEGYLASRVYRGEESSAQEIPIG